MAQPDLWVGTSWKMNKMLDQALAFANRLVQTDAPLHLRRFVVPPFTAVREVAQALQGSSVKIGVQKTPIRVQLNCEQVWNIHHWLKFTEILTNSLFLGVRVCHQQSPACSPTVCLSG